MAETMQSLGFTNPKKRGPPDNEEEEFIAGAMVAPKRASRNDPAGALANARHEFGEHGGVNMSIEASATFTVMEADTLRRMFAGELGPDRDFFIYSRHCNPTVMNLGRQMAALEGTEAAYCTSSGMAAISSVLIQLCGAGGRVVASRCLYGGTHALLAHFLPRACGIRAEFVDIDDIEAVRVAIRSDKEATRVLYVESMSNLTLAVVDMPRLSAVAKEEGVKLVVDNTFTPMVLSLARLGADVVLHRVSKFISGEGDIIAGMRPSILHVAFGGGAEVGDELREEGGPGQGEVVGTDDGEGLGELRTDAAGDFEHVRDNEGFDLVLLGVWEGGGRRRRRRGSSEGGYGS